eukprot:479392_1
MADHTVPLEPPITVIKTKKLTSQSFWTCISYFATMFTLGLHMAAIGPILKDIQKQVSVSLSIVSYIFVTRSIGYMLGSIVAGIITDKYQQLHSNVLKSKSILLKLEPHKIYFIFLVIASISIVLISYSHNFILVMALFLTEGLYFGQCDVYNSLYVLVLFDTDDENDDSVKPYMQFLHFMFGFGAIVSPIIIQFSYDMTQHYTLSMWIMAIISILIGIPLLYFPTPIRKTESNNGELIKEIEMENVDDVNFDTEKEREPNAIKDLQLETAQNKCLKYFIMMLFSIFIGIGVGAEVSYAGYITVYSINYLKSSESIGRYMSSIYWSGFTFTRFAAVFLSKKLSNFKILLFDLILIIIGNLLLISFRNIFVAYIYSFITGMGVGTIFPTIWVYAETTIKVSGKFATMLVFAAATCELIFPTLLGNIMHLFGDKSFELYMLGLTIVMCIILPLIVYFRKKLLFL